MPGIKVAADQHNLVGEVGAGQVRDDVEAVGTFGRLRVKLDVDIQFNRDRHLRIDESHHPVVVLDGQRDLRHSVASRRCSSAARGPSDEDGAAVRSLRLPGQVATTSAHVGVRTAVE
jgi:hypothetical protein